MSIVINSINYLFSPDKDTQSLCEDLIKDIAGNGISHSDITINSAKAQQVDITSQFIWKVKVSLKSSIMTGKETRNAVIHHSLADAQTDAKKQAQHIIQNSLGKIELVHNINEDPDHYFKHSSVKLNGGKPHAVIEACTAGCDRGEVTCPRCMGKGTHKAITRKQDLLGTGENFSAINTCPDCKGKGLINCKTCAGSNETKRLYTIHVDASRKHKDSANIDDAAIKKSIDNFLSHQSHNDLFNQYLTPVISEVKDIDAEHCHVIYKSKTKYVLVNLTVGDNSYHVLGFGDQLHCISKPKILDDTLLPAIENIIGISPKLFSANKCLKLQAMPIMKMLISSDKSRSANELEALLNKQSNQLLSKENAHEVIDKLMSIRSSLTPYFSFYSWLPFIIGGILSVFYFSLKNTPPTEQAILIVIHITVASVSGYFISKFITQRKRKKLALKTDTKTLERIPFILTALMITASSFSPALFSEQTRWGIFYQTEQHLGIYLRKQQNDNSLISNSKLIQIAQRDLKTLGYKAINTNGVYDASTEQAVNNFQQKFKLTQRKYLSKETMTLISRYSKIKQKYFTSH